MKVTEDEWTQIQAKRVRGGSNRVAGASLAATKAPSPNKSKLPTTSKELVKHYAKLDEAKRNKPPYKSRLELHWATRLEVMRRQGEIDGWLYEPFTFKLAEGKRYRADFIAWGQQVMCCDYGHEVRVPVIIAYECKGWHKNYRDSLTHLKWAAQRFPFFQWKKVVRNGKSGFEVYDVVV